VSHGFAMGRGSISTGKLSTLIDGGNISHRLPLMCKFNICIFTMNSSVGFKFLLSFSILFQTLLAAHGLSISI
jgi:hypothetical protein